MEIEHDAHNANTALRILGIAADGHVPPGGGERARTLKLEAWAAQAGISRPGRRKFSDGDRSDINRYTHDPEQLRWPKAKRA